MLSWISIVVLAGFFLGCSVVIGASLWSILKRASHVWQVRHTRVQFKA